MFSFFQKFSQPHESSAQKQILLTGAAGRIGVSLREHLGEHYHLRCLDRARVANAKNVRVVNIRNARQVLKAMQGMDAVIHLAANPNCDQSWNDVYTDGIEGTYNVFEAARKAGVKKIIYASTNHVSGWREIEQELRITPEQVVRPDSLYAVGKAFGEALGQFFVDQYGMSIVCLRIGAFSVEPKFYGPTDSILATWCSPRDLAQLVRRSLELDNLGFQIFYAVSRNTRRFWDISNSQSLLGFKPQDNAEELLKKQPKG